MSYPMIDDSLPEDEKVKLLARQIGELMGGKDPNEFRRFRDAVLVHRYGGRFKYLKSKVCSYLGSRPKKKRTGEIQLWLAIGT